MIESNYTPLRPYTNFKSPSIQTIWNGDHYLINRVILIAFKIFSQNIGTFFYNRYAQLKNLITWSKPPVPANPIVSEPPEPTTSDGDFKAYTPPLINKIARWTPIAAPILPLAGVLAGVFYRAAKSIPNDHRLCDSKDIFLPTINSIKQWELKTFALASILIAASPLIYRSIQNIRCVNCPKDCAYRSKPFQKRIANELYNCFWKYFKGSKSELISSCSLAVLALASPLYAQPLGLKGDGFNSSGHVMLKFSLGFIIGKVFGETAWNHPKFTVAMASTYALTDLIFLANTTAFCHTPQETIAGLLWSASILSMSGATGYLAEKAFNWNNNRKVS